MTLEDIVTDLQGIVEELEELETRNSIASGVRKDLSELIDELESAAEDASARRARVLRTAQVLGPEKVDEPTELFAFRRALEDL